MATKKNSPERKHAPTISVVPDPRDYRELITELLGLSLEASRTEASPPSGESGIGVLARRRREKAWQLFQDPLNRLAEEALLYPIRRIPTPSAEEFPVYQPKLPSLDRLFQPQEALQQVLEVLSEMLSDPPDPPEPEWEEALRPRGSPMSPLAVDDPLDAWDESSFPLSESSDTSTHPDDE